MGCAYFQKRWNEAKNVTCNILCLMFSSRNVHHVTRLGKFPLWSELVRSVASARCACTYIGHEGIACNGAIARPGECRATVAQAWTLARWYRGVQRLCYAHSAGGPLRRLPSAQRRSCRSTGTLVCAATPPGSAANSMDVAFNVQGIRVGAATSGQSGGLSGAQETVAS